MGIHYTGVHTQGRIDGDNRNSDDPKWKNFDKAVLIRKKKGRSYHTGEKREIQTEQLVVQKDETADQNRSIYWDRLTRIIYRTADYGAYLFVSKL